MSTAEETEKVAPRTISVIRQGSDQVFRGILVAGGLAAFVLLSGIFGYLAVSAAPVLRAFGLEFFTGSSWYAGDGLLPSEGSIDPPTFGLAPMLWGSLLIAIIAVVIAVPMAIGYRISCDLFSSEKTCVCIHNFC